MAVAGNMVAVNMVAVIYTDITCDFWSAEPKFPPNQNSFDRP